MLDLQRIENLELTAEPTGQKCIALGLLAPNYWFPPGVQIEVEGWNQLPAEPVIFAMNHTDRYNYWPFQFQLWWNRGRFTASWVKGKYYQRDILADFMEWTNNIPTVSRGYLISRDFMNVVERRPEEDEYGALRDLVDARAHGDPDPELEARARRHVPEVVFEQSRDILGLRYDASRAPYATVLNQLFARMMARFVELNGEALDKGLDLLVFPEGTRSIRLQRGRIGIAQIALYYDATVVPVGCNGSDRIYPGDSPIARSGRVLYRIGEPIEADDRAQYAIDEDFEPFTPEAEERFRDRFRGFVDLIMERIDGLLDPRYQFAGEDDDGRSADRFV
jgi:1-acyl-sn-glycerol-3-phosphate acyltransferase